MPVGLNASLTAAAATDTVLDNTPKKPLNRAATVTAKGWGAQPAKPAPFIWKWSFSKLKAVFFGLFEMSFLMWGRDIPRYASAAGSTTMSYLGSIGLLAALLVGMCAGFMTAPPAIVRYSLLNKLEATEDTKTLVTDLYVFLWFMMTIAMLVDVILCVFYLVMVGMCADDKEASAFLLVRLGKVQKLPVLLFLYGILGLGVPAVLLWCVMGMHWIFFLVVLGALGSIVIMVIIFVALPLIGAWLDTVEAERSGDMSKLTAARGDLSARALSPDVKFKLKAAEKESKKSSQPDAGSGVGVAPQIAPEPSELAA